MTPKERLRQILQFEIIIRADLNRWFLESDLDAEDMAKAVIRALDDWLDEDCVGLEPADEG